MTLHLGSFISAEKMEQVSMPMAMCLNVISHIQIHTFDPSWTRRMHSMEKMRDYDHLMLFTKCTKAFDAKPRQNESG